MGDIIPYRERPSGPWTNDGGLTGGFDAHPRPATEAVGVREYLRIIRRHIWIVLGIVIVSGLYSFNKVMKTPPRYQSRATVRLVDTRTAVTGQVDQTSFNSQFSRLTDALESQIQVMQSRAVGATAVDLKGLRLIPAAGHDFVDEITFIRVADDAAADTLTIDFAPANFTVRTRRAQASANYGQTTVTEGVSIGVSARPKTVATAVFDIVPRETAISHALGGFSASVRDKTDVIDLSYTGAQPYEVKRVVNSMAEGFQVHNAASAQQQSRRRRLFLEGQLRQTDSSLAVATAQYAGYRSGRSVFSSAAKAGAQEQGLVNVDMRRAELDAEKSTYQNLLVQAESSGQPTGSAFRALISSPGLAENPLIQQLSAQLASLERSRDTLMSAGAAASNPDLIAINAMIPQTAGRILDAVRSHVQSLQARIDALDRLRATGASQIAAAPASESQEQQLNRDVLTIQQMAAQLQQELQKAKMAEAVEAGQVEIVDLASLPGFQMATSKSRKLILGILIGLMLGVGAAIGLDSLNNSIRKRSDIERVLNIPGLAVIPRLNSAPKRGRWMARALPQRTKHNRPRGSSTGAADLVTVYDVASTASEAFRTLRTNLMYSQAVEALRSVVVTSAAPGEGKSTTAANVSVTLAQQGLRVLLIDADMRRARIHKMFRIQREPGLSELILGHVDIDQATQPTSVPGLYVLPSGKLPPNPSELAGGDGMRRALQSLSEAYDILIVDSPPLLAASDAAILATLVDGVILVLRAGSTDIPAAQQSMEQLKAVGARVLGAVLNDPDTKVPEYGAYYRYDYDYAVTAD